MASEFGRRQTRLDAGRRDKLITIEQRSIADDTDAEGAPVDAEWTTLVQNVPAARTSQSGWERMKQEQLSARFDARWEINYRPDMDPDLVNVPKFRRIVLGGRVHDITYASQIGRRVGIELYTLASAHVEAES